MDFACLNAPSMFIRLPHPILKQKLTTRSWSAVADAVREEGAPGSGFRLLERPSDGFGTSRRRIKDRPIDDQAHRFVKTSMHRSGYFLMR